ncbi:DUF4185 domain-containing protein [Mycobacterium shimoidei]|uniref:DUF4185 domain-containing protein n=1 Tax=Mycobacterium shimoidei TaxID=29313 RepID=UPI0008486443|nr:DUF4185 domain-containing protein [Mycobacterium shimoidei]MCV7257409.1 DUF4185 domain-containing protein [Mycobacterium shimoidei]ODR13902.1 hypothetical protein BHQ16_07590 [Mycobacterium shimoidei]ORW77584.1 hypothetical protein AWC26_19265 [Mycobacterium shimoidei]
MSALRRIMSGSMASATAFWLVGSIGLAPHAAALTCEAPEANVDPPPAQSAPTIQTPAPRAPRAPIPSYRRPRNANPRAPLPKLGPLISALLNPNGRVSGPVRQQAAIVPPAPNPPGAGQVPPGAGQMPPNAVPLAPEAAPTPPAAEPPPSIAGAPTSLVEWVTGPMGPNKTLERFGISGTDLGIMWDNGDPVNRQVLMAFGDTFGYCKVHGQQWRYNVLFRTSDQNLNDGITVPPGVPNNNYSGSPVRSPAFSKQVIPGIKLAGTQEGMIPTAGIAIGRTQYMNFMSIKNWGRDGEWSTNYSAIAVSKDNGQNWGIYPQTVRPAAADSVPHARYIPGNENFQMGAFLKTGDGYVYSFGTPSGRGGSAYLSRVPQGFIADLTKYQYWNGDQNAWVPANPGAATPVIPGPVGEMSAQYNTYLKQYLVLYTNGNNDVVARTAPAPQGPWSPEQLLVSSFQMPGGIYGPMLHPWASGKDLYFNLSLWSAYDVMLMHTELP